MGLHAGRNQRLGFLSRLRRETAGSAARRFVRRRFGVLLLVLRARRFGGRLGRAQRGANQRLGQHQLALVEIAQRQAHGLFLVGAGVIALQRQDRVAALAFDAAYHAAKTLAAVAVRLRQFDLGLMADRAPPVGNPHQRPVDARRRNFQAIFAGDGVGDIEFGRKRLARRFAVADGHGPVGALGHDLQGLAVLRQQPDAHQPQAELLQHGTGDRGDARGDAGLGNETRLVERSVNDVGVLRQALPLQAPICSGPKEKERVRAWTHSQSAIIRE